MNIVIIGVGNEYRHDDGVGLAIAEQLGVTQRPGVTVAQSDGEPSGLIDLWTGADLAIVIDAVQAGGAPGKIYRLGLHHPSATGPKAASSHGVSLGEAADLARALGRMPERLLFFGVQAACVDPGPGLTPAVVAASDQVVAEISDLLDSVPPAVT